MVHQALLIYSIPASVLFFSWLYMFGLVPALDTLLPITAIGMLIWTYIEFSKVKKLQAAQRKAAKESGSAPSTAGGGDKAGKKKPTKKAD